MKPTVAVIAAGAMGSGVGKRLTENGVTVLTSLEGRSAASAKRASDAGMKAATESEIAAADFILSIVPPGDAQALAERLAPALRASNRKPIYVDCNAVGPDTAKKVAATVSVTGAPFVDGGIIGGPPRAGYTPTLYVSGPDAAKVAVLNDCGLKIKVMPGPVGDASALKMAYAGLNKGLVALGSAMVLAAERAGVGEALREELSVSQVPMLAQLSRGVPDMFPKAYRWVAELEEIARFAGPGAESEIFQGIADLYARIAKDFEGPKAETGTLASFYAAAKK